MAISKEKRRSLIPNLLMAHEGMKNNELADYFHVSAETIRSDMQYLEKKGIVEKSYGKAMVTESFRNDKSYIYERLDQQKDEKMQVAKTAIQLIEDNSIIFLDSGSTVLAIAECLDARKNITVITNSLGVANTVMHQKENSVYLASGFVSQQGMLVNGPYLIDSIRQFKYDLAFLGTNGLKFYDGPTCLNYSHIDVKKTVMKNSEKTIIVCTASKFEDGAVMQFASWENVDILISDRIPEKNHQTLLEKDVLCISAVDAK